MLISRHVHLSRVDKTWSWLFLLPVAAILMIAAFIPLGYGLVLSFHRYKLTIASSRPVFIGFKNYIDMFKDELFIQSLTNNIKFALMTVSFEMVAGVVVAMMISDDTRLTRLLIALLMVPMIIAPVVSGTLWRMMLDRTYGVVNYLLGFIGIPPISFIADYRIAIYAVVFVDCWQFIPFVALLVLSSIKSIPTSLLDAARVDGATS
jgi:multiple sugar transport system permease protein